MIHKSNEEVSSRYGVKQKMTNDSRFSKKDGNGCGEHRGVNSVTYKSGGWCTQVDDILCIRSKLKQTEDLQGGSQRMRLQGVKVKIQEVEEV